MRDEYNVCVREGRGGGTVAAEEAKAPGATVYDTTSPGITRLCFAVAPTAGAIPGMSVLPVVRSCAHRQTV